MTNWLTDLNERQQQAVQAPDGPVLVIAAAGTGKTRALTYRVLHLVDRGIEARRILLLTFTNKAAREMLERARELVGEQVGGLWGGTFHHLANRLLRRHAALLGYDHAFSILDRDDTKRLLRACRDDLGLADAKFPKPEVLGALFGYAVNAARPLPEVVEERFRDHPVDPDAVLAVFARYQERKRLQQAMDFDDLLVNALRLLEEHADLRAHYSERFQHVLVDEYQDTNPLQAAWVDLFAGHHHNLFVVGDDFQSIYAWRGADFRNIISFPERYPETQVFLLETNYRSTPGILAVANACIAGNPAQFQKTLRAVRADDGPPHLARLPDGRAQANYVIDAVRHALAAGCPAAEIAILYRAHYQALEMQLELQRAEMPFVITSGLRFFEQAHVKDLCTLPRLAANPIDFSAFQRLLALLPRVGERTAAKIWERLGRRFDPLASAERAALQAALPAPARERWAPLAAALDALVTPAEGPAPAPLLQAFFEGFYEQYNLTTYENAPRRQEDLDELVRFAAKHNTLAPFLNESALLTNTDAENDEPEADRLTGVRLSTIHQAKGLEWRHVFVLWLTEEMFPTARSVKDPAALEEERRLFYVAVTRARDQLHLCVPRMRRARDGSIQFCSPSRFVEEIDSRLFHTKRAAARPDFASPFG